MVLPGERGRAARDKRLRRCRTYFVEHLTEAVLRNLLDDLEERHICNDAEVETVVQGNRVHREQARALIDMVIKKGRIASEILLDCIRERDSCLGAGMQDVLDAEATEKQVQPTAKIPPQKAIPVQETGPAQGEHWITPCAQDVFKRIHEKEAGQFYDIKEKNDRRRLALIINNEQFDSLPERNGSQHDEVEMKRLLQGLGYAVQQEKNLSSKDMETALTHFSKRPEHENSDSTFIVILSHGLRDGICGRAFKPEKQDTLPTEKQDILPTDTIFRIFNNKNCKALRGKPKVIIIQACRGDQNGVTLVSDSISKEADAVPVPRSMELHEDAEMEDDAIQKILVECDFLCFCSSTPDTKSWRSISSGSPFIQKLIEIVRKEACSCCLEDLFQKVQQSFVTSQLQMPTKERTTTCKKFYLFPGH
ncbi:caspase-1-like isoform X2 [Ambystoma mexicanum]|uniref:caspase-1-like isoform X2 n=1 Tax=Ambystoma mexicanum TaxID=8296 RepID=UPI0037E7DB32